MIYGYKNLFDRHPSNESEWNDTCDTLENNGFIFDFHMESHEIYVNTAKRESVHVYLP